MFRFSAWVPEWASLVHVHVNVFVPYPARLQQVGMPLVPDSRPGFCNRLWFVTITVTDVVVVLFPAVSTARAATVWLPSGTDVESQLNEYGVVVAVPTTLPSTKKSTWSTATLSLAVADSVTVPAAVEPALGAVSDTIGDVGSIWTFIVSTASTLPAT